MKRSCSLNTVCLIALVTSGLGIARAEENAPTIALSPRYGQEVDAKRYPQADPQGAIRSVVRAASKGQIEYLLAHLISPTQVDKRLAGDMAAFRKLTAKATPDKSKQMIAQLQGLLDEGTWTIRRNTAWAKAEGLPDLSLEKVGSRWFMHNSAVKAP